MKTIIITLLTLSSIAMAAEKKKAAKSESMDAPKSFARNYGMAGCGLGSVVMGKDGGQISAATTNGTFYSQYFGITTGSLNCADGTENQVARKSDFFIHANRYAVQLDISRGQGETLAGLNQILGCSANSGHLNSVLKANYSQIFNQEGAPANVITDQIITIIINDEKLARECTLG